MLLTVAEVDHCYSAGEDTPHPHYQASVFTRPDIGTLTMGSAQRLLSDPAAMQRWVQQLPMVELHEPRATPTWKCPECS